MTTENNPNKAARRRSAARLAAVQALYEMELSGSSATPVLQEFMEDRWRAYMDDDDRRDLSAPDGWLLAEIVRGVSARGAELDDAIGPALTGERPIGRLEPLTLAILRAGAFELLALASIPARVVINEYIEVTRAFYAGPESGLVNGILDHLARVLRADEFKAG